VRTRSQNSACPLDRAAVTEGEIVKLVQQAFILADEAKAPRIVAFCGVDKNVGCSWVCERAGEALAEQVPGSVCIVDANLRSPSIHDHFHAELGQGFVDALRNPTPVREFARPTWNSRLWFMTAGMVKGETGSSLNPACLRARFSDLRDEFDHVLVDTPPLSSYADSLALGKFVDGVVLVVNASSTRRETARAAKENLSAAGIPVLGAVLNKRQYPIPAALYRRL